MNKNPTTNKKKELGQIASEVNLYKQSQILAEFFNGEVLYFMEKYES
tara:strand:+ start:194 stop:334 length:141 start_codon:yes stop_codon:yes gene_type:complete